MTAVVRHDPDTTLDDFISGKPLSGYFPTSKSVFFFWLTYVWFDIQFILVLNPQSRTCGTVDLARGLGLKSQSGYPLSSPTDFLVSAQSSNHAEMPH
jgi:hypothetical protein